VPGAPQFTEVARPREEKWDERLVAAHTPGAACPVAPSEKLAAGSQLPTPATKSATADFTRTPYAWMASQRPNR
jgi:hypothetical protein